MNRPVLVSFRGNNLKKAVLRWSALLPLVLLMSACNSASPQPEPPPPGVLGKDSFARLLRDFALAESAANINVKNVSLQKMDSVYAFDPLAEHGIRKSQYDSTLNYYVKYPELYKEVYTLVLEELSKLESSRNSAKADSLVVPK